MNVFSTLLVSQYLTEDWKKESLDFITEKVKIVKIELKSLSLSLLL